MQIKFPIIANKLLKVPDPNKISLDLLKLLKSELEHRETQHKDKFLKNAGFYSLKTFDGFRFDEVTLPAAVSPDYLRSCEFINTKTNLVMYSNVSTGTALKVSEISKAADISAKYFLP